MRNATVSALIYELLFHIYDRIPDSTDHIPDEDSVVHKAFSHEFTSRWEWSTDLLNKAGAVKQLPSPYVRTDGSTGNSPFYIPVMTLEECRAADFSRFETFENYCVAMFTFEQFVDYDYVAASSWSPFFHEALAMQDDIFVSEEPGGFTFNQARFRDKVMTRWDDEEDLMVRDLMTDEERSRSQSF